MGADLGWNLAEGRACCSFTAPLLCACAARRNPQPHSNEQSPFSCRSRRWVTRPAPPASGGALGAGLDDSYGSLPARDVLVPKRRSAQAGFPYHDVVCSAAGRVVCDGGSNTGFAAPALAVSGFALTPPLPFWADKALFPALAGAPRSSLLHA